MRMEFHFEHNALPGSLELASRDLSDVALRQVRYPHVVHERPAPRDDLGPGFVAGEETG